MGFSLRDIGKFLKSEKFRDIAQQVTGMPLGGDSDPEDNEAPGGYQTMPGGPMIKNLRANPAMMSADTASAPVIPAPVRTPPTIAQPVAPTGAPLPPPQRVPIAGEAPMPTYIDQMEGAFQNTPTPSIGPGSYVSADGSIQGLQYNDKAPMIPAPQRSVTPIETPVAPDAPMIPAPQRSVFIGEKTTGMSPAQRAAARVRTLEGADPQSKVTETSEGYEVAPPQKMSRLKAMGKMFLQRMMAGSQYGLGGMLGAGAVGAVEGGTMPGRTQRMMRQGEIATAQGQQATAQALEARGLQNQAQTLNIEQDRQQILSAPRREAEAAYRQDRADLEQMAAAVGNQRSDDPNRKKNLEAIQTEADRMSKKYGRTVTVIPGEGKSPPRIVVDQEVLQEQPDGSLKSIWGSPKTDTTAANHDQDAAYKWETAKGKAEADRAQFAKAAEAAKATAEDHQRKVSAAAGALTNLDAQMAGMPATVPSGQVMADGVTPKMMANPALGPLKRQREQLKQQQTSAESAMNQAYKDQRKAEADAAGVYVPPPPPRRGKGAAPTGAKIMPRANLPAAAARLLQEGKIKNASEAEAYITANGGVVQ